MVIPEGQSPATLARRQRSHLLFVLSDLRVDGDETFLNWYLGSYRTALTSIPGVLSARLYKRHNVDITCGRYPALAYRYLGICEIAVDGAPAARAIIEAIEHLHADQASSAPPATWLYYPASERVGQAPSVSASTLTIAFANPVTGKEDEFREWYATRHIRHALYIPALVSGQCFLRTQFQRPGALAASFHTIAMYDQVGSVETLIESLNSLPVGALDFPSMDSVCFAEGVYEAL